MATTGPIITSSLNLVYDYNPAQTQFSIFTSGGESKCLTLPYLPYFNPAPGSSNTNTCFLGSDGILRSWFVPIRHTTSPASYEIGFNSSTGRFNTNMGSVRNSPPAFSSY